MKKKHKHSNFDKIRVQWPPSTHTTTTAAAARYETIK